MIAKTKPRFRRDAAYSPLEAYLREIEAVPLLTAEEEVALALEIAEGSVAARERMIRANLRLVVAIARGFAGKGLPIQDLVEEGNIGLIRAAEGFDPGKGTRFSTYATHWIRQKIRRALSDNPRPLRIPAYGCELHHKWRKAAAILKEKLGRTPDDREVADALEVPDKGRKVLGQILAAHRMAQVVEAPDSRESVISTIADRAGDPPEAAAELADELGRLSHHLEDLAIADARTAEAVRLRFGLGSEPPMTLAAIGLRMGVTKERARQVVDEALGLLRARMTNDGLIPAARRRA